MTNKSAATGFKVTEDSELMAFLLQKLPQQSRTSIKTLLQNRQIWIDGQPITQFNYQLKIGQQVDIQHNKGTSAERPRSLPILFEDAHLIVVEKPAGLLSMATDREKEQTAYSQLSSYVKQQNPPSKIFIVHRLDRETSGVMVFAKSAVVQERLQNAWNTDTKERIYLAITEGVPALVSGKITSYLSESKAFIVYSSQNPQRGQYAASHYEVLKNTRANALLKVRLETGRKNQVRVHLQDLNTPIVGDKKYGATTNPIRRLGLHAWVLAFEHPITGKLLRFETKIPLPFADFFK